MNGFFRTTDKDKNKDEIEVLRQALETADAVVIGAGSGLSTAAGFTYSGERFRKYFADFIDTYHFRDMYSGGFYPFSSLEEHWAYWSRYIYINRYMDAPKPVYEELFRLVKDKDYFVLTTNVDHCFQKAGFDKGRLFYTQGDYGLFQCSKPCRQETFDNEDAVRRMVEAQGYQIAPDGSLILPEIASQGAYKQATPPQDAGEQKMQPQGTPAQATPSMRIPAELVPRCPHCGRPMAMNLRSDGTFAEDEGWHNAAKRYETFMENHRGQKVVFLELGVGYNTPGIIKYNFWQYAYNWQHAFYACINKGQAQVPIEIKEKSVGIDGDIGEVLRLI